MSSSSSWSNDITSSSYDRLISAIDNEEDAAEINGLLVGSQVPEILGRKDGMGDLPLHCCLASHLSPTLDTVRLLVKSYPEALTIQNRQGELPIHLAVAAFGGQPKITQFLIDANTATIRVQDGEGNLPLHYAVENGAEIENKHNIQSFIEHYPEGVSVANFYGELPIHSLLCGPLYGDMLSHMPPLVKLLINANPETVKTKNDFSDLPLHCILHCPESLSYPLVRHLMEVYPHSLSVPGYCGELPLHLLLSFTGRATNCCKERNEFYLTLQEAINNNRNGLFTRDKKGHLPLPQALRFYSGKRCSKCVHGVITMVTEHCGNEVLATPDGNGRTVLHCALCDNLCKLSPELVQLVQLLIDKFPQAIQIKDDKGMSPLHVVCDGFWGFDELEKSIVNLLITPFPQACNLQDQRGKLPLHYAANRCNLGLVKFLLCANQEAVGVFDLSGSLPIHLACHHCRGPDVIKHLADARPGTLLQEDGHGETALFIALRSQCTDSALFLIKQYPKLLQLVDGKGLLPLQYLFSHGWNPSFGLDGKYGDKCQNMLEEMIDGNPVALEVGDKEGNLPIHLVARNTRMCETRDKVAAISILAGKNHDTLHTPNNTGETPAHIVATLRHPEALMGLVARFPEILQDADNDGRLVLHRLVVNVDWIFRRRPSDGSTTSLYDRLVLNHLEYQGWHAWQLLIKTLVDAFPVSVKIRDNHGSLPIHLACGVSGHVQYKTAVVEYLLQEYPESAYVENKDGDTPLLIAAAADATSLDLLFLLVQQSKDLTTELVCL